MEVIRGPQGAALYGSDAISGVVNIVTRHEGADGTRRADAAAQPGGAGGERLRARTTPPPGTTACRCARARTWARPGSRCGCGRTGAIYTGAQTAPPLRRGRRAAGDAHRHPQRLAAHLRPARRGGREPAAERARNGPRGARRRLARHGPAVGAALHAGDERHHRHRRPVDAHPARRDRRLPAGLRARERGRRAAGERRRAARRARRRRPRHPQASSTLRLDDGTRDAQGTLTFAFEESVLRQRTAVTETSRPSPAGAARTRCGARW